MKRFIRYLYEYECEKRTRNVGFVKVETGDVKTTLWVQAKGFHRESGQKLMLYLFYEEAGELLRISKEEIRLKSPFLHCCLTYTCEEYQKIKGIMLETENGRRIAATWDDKSVDVSRVREFEPSISERGLEEENGGQEPREYMDLCPRGDDTGCKKENEEHDDHEHNEITPDPAKRQKTITKIQRKDISKLPRCEWKLANNQFLIHGYNNYHYLVLIEEENVLKLGVPGIYHIKEEKYANMFGFDEFFAIDEPFGYWCRQVKSRQTKHSDAIDIKEK